MRLLVALAVLTLLAAVNYSPQLLAQGAAFLSVPYYGSRTVNSFFDNEYPDYVINDRIVMYDGSVARRSHGTCGGSSMAYFSQPYGQGKCIWYDGHSGYDFALVNEKVLASADGQIYQARWWDWNNRNAALGLFIDINHDGGYVTRYAHLSAALVSANTNVIKGEIIGVSGNTGNSSGPHLHFWFGKTIILSIPSRTHHYGREVNGVQTNGLGMQNHDTAGLLWLMMTILNK